MVTISLNITSSETIKPSSPTPHHLRIHSLSLLDQNTDNLYIPVLLFYSNDGSAPPSNGSQHLQRSLSKTLTKYYPFAGRLADSRSINCTDEGVGFIEGRVGSVLSQVLERPKPETLDLLYPSEGLWNESYKGSLVIFQATYFECGGLAIATRASHQVADASALNAFLSDWAVAARDNQAAHETPLFISAMLPTPSDSLAVQASGRERENCVTRRIVFESSKIAQLKAMVAKDVQNPTRVEVVTALIYKNAMAMTRGNSSSLTPSILIQTVNMRRRISPPLPENSIGNFSWFHAIFPKDESEKNLIAIVGALRKGIEQLCNKYATNKTANQCYSLLCDTIKETEKLRHEYGGTTVFMCSSLCGYPFSKIDFGWGEPIWVCSTSSQVKNWIVLVDGKGGGIEAWVTMEEQDMAAFERDEELLGFTSPNLGSNY
ncbi:Acylsugar acyltransferase [Actinidia chinensis var. chinensis]|uniref:Acylsugar acyltransferase n=1 Tax=Actinidia chinensis var. chinensis TaxID=1590841 RepID=A0A2R6PJ30_ACTCC|nr:Acylsugar acyltransferase [Actinidia chinensis var. chinensis]